MLPGMGTGDNPGEVRRPARWRGLHRCCAYPLHCLPGPPHTTLHNTAQAPAELYLLPRSRSREAKFHQLSTFAERGLFCCAPLFPQGWSSCMRPLFRGPLAHSCSPFLVGIVPGPATSTNSIVTVLTLSALTSFHRETHEARGPVGMSVRGKPTRPLTRAIWVHVGMPCHPEGRLPKQGWAQIGPTLKRSPSTGHGITVNHKIVDPCSFLFSRSPWPLRISPTLRRTECAWLETWVSEIAKNLILENKIEGLTLPFCFSHPQRYFLQGQEENEMPPLVIAREGNGFLPPQDSQGIPFPH